MGFFYIYIFSFKRVIAAARGSYSKMNNLFLFISDQGNSLPWAGEPSQLIVFFPYLIIVLSFLFALAGPPLQPSFVERFK